MSEQFQRALSAVRPEQANYPIRFGQGWVAPTGRLLTVKLPSTSVVVCSTATDDIMHPPTYLREHCILAYDPERSLRPLLT